MKLNPKELNKLLDQVADDVAGILAKADESEKTLAKADPGEEAPGEETPAGSSTEGSAPAPEADPSEGPEGSAGDAGPAAEAPAPEAAPGDEQTQNPAEDESAGPEALVAEYSKLPIEELKMHVMASHAALMQAIGGGDGQEAAPEAPAPEAPGAAPEGTQPAGTEEPPMGKGEAKSCEGNGGKIVKSQIEARLATLEKSLKEKDETIQALETKFGEATEGLKKLVEKSGNVALRKSIAGISFQGKPGDSDKQEVRLSKSEAIQKLNALTATPDLKKSDRALITQYVIGQAPQSTISHLLK